MLAPERIVFAVDWCHRRSPVRDVKNPGIGNSALNESRGHAPTDRHNGIAALERHGGNGPKQTDKWTAFWKHTDFLGDLGVKILSPVDDLVALEKADHWPQNRQHGRIGHRYHKVCPRQEQGPHKQPGNHQEIARRPQNDTAP